MTHPTGGAKICHRGGYRNPKHHWRSHYLAGGVYTYIYIYRDTNVYKGTYIFWYVHMFVCIYLELHNTSLKKYYELKGHLSSNIFHHSSMGRCQFLREL